MLDYVVYELVRLQPRRVRKLSGQRQEPVSGGTQTDGSPSPDVHVEGSITIDVATGEVGPARQTMYAIVETVASVVALFDRFFD